MSDIVLQESIPAAARGRAIGALHLPGCVPYLPMWDAQRVLAAARANGEIGDLVLLLEHEHVYTNGRAGDRAHLLADEGALLQLNAAYHVIDRGGDVTYHGPGQLVVYPIVHLGDAGLSVRSYVREMEAAIIEVVAAFGIEASRIPGYTGVWVGDDKLAAIGVKVSYGVAYHGFALNVSTDLSYFEHIVPCGISGRSVTSMTRLLGHPVSVDEVAPVCAQVFADTFGQSLRWIDRASLCLISNPAGLVSLLGRRQLRGDAVASVTAWPNAINEGVADVAAR